MSKKISDYTQADLNEAFKEPTLLTEESSEVYALALDAAVGTYATQEVFEIFKDKLQGAPGYDLSRIHVAGIKINDAGDGFELGYEAPMPYALWILPKWEA